MLLIFSILNHTFTSYLDCGREISPVSEEDVGLVISAVGGKLGKNPPRTLIFRTICVHCVGRVLSRQWRRQINANLRRSRGRHVSIFIHSFNDIELDRFIMM